MAFICVNLIGVKNMISPYHSLKNEIKNQGHPLSLVVRMHHSSSTAFKGVHVRFDQHACPAIDSQIVSCANKSFTPTSKVTHYLLQDPVIVPLAQKRPNWPYYCHR